MRAIIENVRANEELYQHLEVEMRWSYRLNKEATHRPESSLSDESTLRCVLQDNLVFIKRTQVAANVAGSSLNLKELYGYDGEMTRRLEGDVGNLHHGRDEHWGLYRPHTWLLSRAFVVFPLSLWLRGGKDLQNHPLAGGYKNDVIQQTTCEGDEVVDGLKCYRLRCESLNNSKPPTLNTLRFLWLAPDRNYLPVKTVGYAAQLSLKVPVEEGRLSDFREVAPGVWLPYRRSIRVNDGLRAAKGERFLGNTEEAFLEKLNLDPQYDISLFRDIPFPDGTIVYEVKDGRIIKSYQQGKLGAMADAYRRHKRSIWLMVAISLAIVLAVVGLHLRRRWRSQRAPLPPRSPGRGSAKGSTS
jgi:hypothetical protein